mmetsp:Transcript_8169/g.20850  ORF Transcript_8169/g.20850 Transcript_8169/m.20850 type:complete len:496 (+) Transcript_8169:291-1778(+)
MESKKGTGAAAVQSADVAMQTGEIAPAIKKPQANAPGGIAIEGRAATPQPGSGASPGRPPSVPAAKVKLSSVSANPPMSPAPPAAPATPGSMRPFTPGSERLNQRLSTPKFSPVSPGLILAQQSTGARAGSQGTPPPTAGGSIVHAMEASRTNMSSQGRPAMGILVTGSRPATGASAAGRPQTEDRAVKLAAYRRKMALTAMAKEGTITEAELSEHQKRQHFNAVVAKLRERVQSSAQNSLGSHFASLDVNKDGVLQPAEFKRALSELNLGHDVNDYVFANLLKAADLDHDNVINYAEFTQALRQGRLQYMPLNPNIKTRTLPDPDNPFGDPNADMKLPFGIQSDALANIKAYDARVDSLYKSLEDTFHQFDRDNSGEVDWKEFKAAMTEMVQKQGIHLSEEEIRDLFRNADLDHSGAINWAEFVRSFQGGARKRFIPEFLKPKSMRCSMLGAPWEWVVDPESVDAMCNSAEFKEDAATSTADDAAQDVPLPYPQ